jgi:predicted PurR-regulated permease PerM
MIEKSPAGDRKMHSKEKENGGRHLWRITAVRDFLWIMAAVALLWLLYHLRHILLPIFAGRVLAYLLDPVITKVKSRWGISRLFSVLLICSLVLLAGAGIGLWAIPLLIKQSVTLAQDVPDYFQALSLKYGIQLEDLAGRFNQFQGSEDGISVFRLVKNIAGTTAGILLWLLLPPVYFVFFALKFQFIKEEGLSSLAAERHPRAMDILRRMDEAIGTFFRARLLISLLVGVIFIIGWWLANIPYWFLLGAVTGILSMIPYLSIAGWLLALLVKYFDMTIGDGAPGFEWMAVLLWPSLVFGIGNFIEGWILTPWIHGRTTRLSAIMILTVVLVGGALAGFWGLLFGIPAAICLNILVEEFLQPTLREAKKQN